jgi:hypothetical protein
MTCRNSDEGAALIIVLVIVTVMSVAMGALLSLTTSSERTTIGMRDQAATAYNGDGATQAAIDALRLGSFNNQVGTQCFGGTGTLSLRDFYPASGGQNGPSSAAVSCTAEPGTGDQGSPVPITAANKPGNAVFTLGTSAAETGQTYGQSNKPVTIRGGVISNSTINSSQAQLTVTGNAPVRAVSGCTGPITPACTATAPVADPNYPAPTDPPAPPASLPACTNQTKVAEFSPGLYTDASILNNCKASWLLFDPGTYYFDFTSAASHVWTISSTAVGGTLTGAKSNTPPAVPGACVNPINSTSAVGVELVFGGDSQLVFDKGVQAEFCATYHQNTIPTVLYGLKANLGAVHAQSGCVVQVGGCDLVSDGTNGTKPSFFFEGFAYVPLSSINIAVNNTTQPYFNFGIVARRLTFTTTGSACTPPACAAFISLPDNSPGYGIDSTIVDLTAWVCPGVSTSTCAADASRRLALTARVQLRDPTGSPVPGARQVTVLSWAVNR